jgi:hypothetical protein
MIGDSVPFAAAAASCPVCLLLSRLLLTPARGQLGEIRRDRRDDRTLGINQPIGLEQIAGRLQTTPSRHHQHRQIPQQISIADHEQRT